LIPFHTDQKKDKVTHRDNAWGRDSDSEEEEKPKPRPRPPRIFIIHPPPTPTPAPAPAPSPSTPQKTSRSPLSLTAGFTGSWSVHLHYSFNKYTDGKFLSNALTLGTGRSAEEFDNIFQGIPRPSEVFCVHEPDNMIGFAMHRTKMVEAFSVFREGIRPTWDDPHNSQGGHYELTGTLSLDNIDCMWDHALSMLVGLRKSDKDITGARIVDKTRVDLNSILYRLEIWFSDTVPAFPSEIQQLLQSLPFPVSSVVWKSHTQIEETKDRKKRTPRARAF
jgi:hypothetical protein